MKKILILTHNYPTSSTERRNAGIFVHDFAKELVKIGVRVYVFCPSSSKNSDKIEGIPVYWFSWGRNNKSLKELKLWNPVDLINVFIFFFRGIRESLSFADKIKPDYCLSMWSVPSGVFAYVIRKKFNIRYGVWVLGSDIYVYAKFLIFSQIIKQVIKGANHVFSDGFELAHIVKSFTGRKCYFLPSSTRFDGNVKLINVRVRGEKTILTYVGRAEPEKGLDLLIETMLKMSQKNRENFTVNIVGDGSLLRGLKVKAKQMNLGSYFHFYGNINDKNKIFNILSSSDWLVIPSRSDSIPLIFSESMKAGTPVIASALPDLRKLIDKYQVGIYFKPDNEDDLEWVILNLPPERKRRIMSRNTKKAAKAFSLNSSVKKFLSYVNEQ